MYIVLCPIVHTALYVCVGKILQQFDYSRDEDEKEFMCSAVSPSGQTVVIGSFDRYVHIE